MFEFIIFNFAFALQDDFTHFNDSPHKSVQIMQTFKKKIKTPYPVLLPSEVQSGKYEDNKFEEEDENEEDEQEKYDDLDQANIYGLHEESAPEVLHVFFSKK